MHAQTSSTRLRFRWLRAVLMLAAGAFLLLGGMTLWLLRDPAPSFAERRSTLIAVEEEAENVLRPHLEEYPTRWRSWGLLVEVILAKGDREEAIRISNHVAELEARVPGIEASGRALTLMHLGDRAGAVEALRPLFAQRKPVYLLRNFHRFGGVPQTVVDYAPLRELVGWPPPAPN